MSTTSARTPELLVDFITTLDSCASGEGWPGWWGVESPEYLAWLAEQPDKDHTALMGANTYRMYSSFAAAADDGSSGMSEEEAEAIRGVTEHPTVVFSSTLTAPLAWPNAELVDGDAVEAVTAMKREGTRSFRTNGSLTLCRSLLSAGLVDRFRVVVFPFITGRTGRERIYDGYPDVALELVQSRTFDGRLQLLEYVPTVISGPPGTSRA